jgi:hypothetical protein
VYWSQDTQYPEWGTCRKSPPRPVDEEMSVNMFLTPGHMHSHSHGINFIKTRGDSDWCGSYESLTEEQAELGHQYGAIYLNDAGGATILSTIGTTPEQLAVFSLDGPATTGVVPSAANDQITVVFTGYYMVTFNCAAATVAAGDSGSYQFRLRVNGVEPVTQGLKLGTERDFSGTNDVGSCGFSGICNLTANDVLSVWIESDSGANTDDLKFYDVQFSVVKVDV